MSEKEFNFQTPTPDKDPEPEERPYPRLGEPSTSGAPQEEDEVESEDEGVREVSLSFPENEAWPPQPESQEPSDGLVPPPPNAPVRTYGEAVEELNREEPEEEAGGEPTPVPIYNGKPAIPSSQSFGGVINGTEFDGFYFYTIKHSTGITLNGRHFDQGSYWFDLATYEGVLNIDLPFQ